MPTMSGTFDPNAAPAASIQAWATWVESVLLAAGWTVTGDTGQTPPGSLPAATANNQQKGYRVYKSTNYHSTYPLYMRWDYGSGEGSSPGWGAAIWPAIGNGTDGLGNITQPLFAGYGVAGVNQPAISTNQGGTVVGSQTCFASFDNSRLVLGMWATNGLTCTVFSIERSRNSSGLYTDDGVFLIYHEQQLNGGGGVQTVLGWSRYLILGSSNYLIQPQFERGLNYILSSFAPADQINGAVGLGVIIPIKGIAQQPGINLLVGGAYDVSPTAPFQVTIYGVLHTFIVLQIVAAVLYGGGAANTNNGYAVDGYTRVIMLYE